MSKERELQPAESGEQPYLLAPGCSYRRSHLHYDNLIRIRDSLPHLPSIAPLAERPCTAKKAECEMELFYEEYAGHDVDVVVTTRELVKMIRSAHIRPETLKDVESDRPMQELRRIQSS